MSSDPLAAYVPKTAYFEHQRECLRASARKWNYAVFLDQGLGKTKVIIDTTALLFERGIINALFVLSINGVHEQWVDEQIPLHLPDRIARRCAVWRSSSAKRIRECEALIKRPPQEGELLVLAMNHEALSTQHGADVAVAFLKAHTCLLEVDESHHYKTPKAQRTRVLQHRLRPLAKVRRITTGTPDDTPFDLFPQFRFLDERILGFDSLLSFKHHYGVFTTEFTRRKNKQGQSILFEYETLQEYQRLDELNARIAPYSFRKLKEECTDLPPKIYARRQVELTVAQRKIYATLKEDGLALLRKAEEGQPIQLDAIADLDPDALLERIKLSADRMTIRVKLTLILRLLQCAGGFVTDDEHHIRAIDPLTPKVEAALDLAQNARGKVLIWAQFRPELEALLTHFIASKENAALIFGATTPTIRVELLKRFKDPSDKLRVLIAHPKTIGTGQNLQVAQTVIYYSNSYSHIQRTQSEDRVHRIGQKGTVSVYDLVATAADEEVLKVLSDKQRINNNLFKTSSDDLARIL